MSARRHWVGLDDAIGRLLPRPGMLQARERFARRATALTDIYVARILRTVGAPATDAHEVTRHLHALQQTHHVLTEALVRAWTMDQNSPGDCEGPHTRSADHR